MMTISEYQSEKDHRKLASKPSPPRCLSSCFAGVSDDDGDDVRVRTPRSKYAWIKSTAAHELPEIRERCRSLIARIGRHGHRRQRSSDFSYDASSYALNFEDSYGRDGDSFVIRGGFSARLPATPPQTAMGLGGSGMTRRDILGFS